MSLQTRIESLVLRLAEEFKSVHGQIGSTDGLNTTNKTSLVSAINELREQIDGAAGGAAGGTVIDDDQVTSTSTTFSAAKIKILLDTLKTELTGGTDATLNTLRELQAAVLNDQTGAAALLAALDKRVRFDAAQALTPEQQAQARANIGAMAADTDDNEQTDFVAVFETALIGV